MSEHEPSSSEATSVNVSADVYDRVRRKKRRARAGQYAGGLVFAGGLAEFGWGTSAGLGAGLMIGGLVGVLVGSIRETVAQNLLFMLSEWPREREYADRIWQRAAGTLTSTSKEPRFSPMPVFNILSVSGDHPSEPIQLGPPADLSVGELPQPQDPQAQPPHGLHLPHQHPPAEGS